ncbi:hypothetical protein ILYODFUR_032071 [Ilyodon furcidens]|uniref:Uncharacterized protein n=1 Tax=Ilyodon furcidens TaxID=33524 RepID=A0ABV0V7Y9_9TELE
MNSFTFVKMPTKPLLFTSRQNTLILHLCVFILVIIMPFRALTLKTPLQDAASDPAVRLRPSPLLYPRTGPRLGQKAQVKQKDYECHSHQGSQIVRGDQSTAFSHLRQVSSHIQMLVYTLKCIIRDW